MRPTITELCWRVAMQVTSSSDLGSASGIGKAINIRMLQASDDELQWQADTSGLVVATKMLAAFLDKLLNE